METNQYEFDRTQQQKQLYPNKPMAENVQEIIQAQNQQMPKRNVRQKPGTQAKMPKARAMELANALKRTLAVASIISFGMFGGLVAMHQVGAITTQSTSGSSNTNSNQNTSS